MIPGRSDEPLAGEGGLPVLLVLKTFWGVASLLALAAYSLLHTVNEDPSAESAVVVQPRAAPTATRLKSGPVVIGNVTMYPSMAPEPSLVVHFACNQEDARVARIYDPQPAGRSVILRIDQSLDEMRQLYAGTDKRYPKDTRLVTTPCTQALIDSGGFP